MSDELDATCTDEVDGGDVPEHPRTPANRLVAPLQYRDRERYEVLGEHGRGGLGYVQRAHDKELGRPVAIKELIKRGDLGEVRFLREALITARLEHPGIVPIHEAGRWPDGSPFYVMKLVAGRSLKQLIEERSTVAARLELLHHVIAIADAVAYAHQRKIIHRDLKPGNVIAGDYGETIVIDWGLAKDLDAAEDESIAGGAYRTGARSDLTVTGSVLGTPLYMAPEQARGEAVDQRADVFAIGAMLWELCSLHRVPPIDVRARERMLRRSRIDQDLIAIVMKSLAPDPSARYRDAGELAADLKAFKAGSRIAGRQYSVFAVLAHWLRHHRVLAASVTLALALAFAGSIFYIRNIAVARDHAEAQRAIAATERDNARLAQASALLDKDPTRARDVLANLPSRTPQAALLRSRANRAAAARVLRVPGGITRLAHNPTTSEIAFVSLARTLTTIDLAHGELRVIDRDVQPALARGADGWVYARKPPSAPTATFISTSTPRRTIDVGSLLVHDESRLLVAAGRTFALDRGDLYVIEDTGPKLFRREVRGIAGGDRVLMVCTTAGQLEVMRDGIVERRSRCASNESAWPMAVAGTDYAALLDPSTLLLVRDGRELELPTRVTGEYELALSASGLLALADFDGKAWFVRSGGDRLELAPSHAARLLSVVADGELAAWGYDDGVAVVLDTKTGQTWKLIGPGAAASQLALDARRRQLVSKTGDELRTWSLAPSPLTRIGSLPCLAFHAIRSPDGARILLDCDDGVAREWLKTADSLRALHHHDSIAYGAAWLGDAACTAGFDGRLLCTSNGGTRELRRRGSQIRRMVAHPRGDRVVVATEDGKIDEIGADGIAVATLYTHTAAPYSAAISSDGSRLATGAADGRVIVYDLEARKIRSSTQAHPDLVTSVAWGAGELWTSGLGGAINRWRDDGGTLTAIETIQEPGSARFLHLFPDGWSASTGGRSVVVHRASGALRLDMDRHVELMEISADDRYLAAGTPSEVVVIDLFQRAIATLPVGVQGGYMGFAVPGALTISNADGVVTVSLASLEYVEYDAQRKQ